MERDIRDIITKILQSSNTPYLINGAGILTAVYGNQSMEVLVSSLGMLTHNLRNIDLREYAPPMRKENLFIQNGDLFKIKYFNSEYKLLVKK